MLKTIPKLINKIIKVLIVSDFFLNLGWGLMGPVFAIFIVQNITIGSISEAAKIAGNNWHGIVGTAIYTASDIRRAAEELTSKL